MEKGYFSAAWNDIVKSPGWFSRILRMGLLCIVPIFGILVTYGYFYGWAREIAWNVHRPMPERIFGNEDGNLYKRGFFILVICFVFSLIPGVFMSITSALTGFSFFGSTVSSSFSLGLISLFMGSVFSVVGFVLTFAVMFFYWVGAMRCSLYNTLSSGFQIGKIWAMIRYDFSGLLRIFGMVIVCSIVVGAIACTALFIVVFAGFSYGAFFVRTQDQAVVLIFVLLLVALLLGIVSLFLMVFVVALVTRALGYWIRQFQVNLWGGQEDPMPFEVEAARRAQEDYRAYTERSNYQRSGSPQQADSSVNEQSLDEEAIGKERSKEQSSMPEEVQQSSDRDSVSCCSGKQKDEDGRGGSGTASKNGEDLC